MGFLQGACRAVKPEQNKTQSDASGGNTEITKLEEISFYSARI
jgi:hypothetical protein